MRRARAAALGLLAAGSALLVVGALGPTFAAFASRTASDGNVVQAAQDFRPPLVGTVAVGKVAGGAPGFVKAGGEYFVYANVAADTGAPASGIATVRANLTALSAGAGAITLAAGNFSAGGVSYGYRGGPLTASAVAEGAKAFTVTATDLAGNANSREGTATVDNTAPQASDVQTTNAATAGQPDQNDTIVFTFTEPVEPGSILAGWNGAATNVVVRVNDGILGLVGNDSVQVFKPDNATVLPLGAVDLGRGDYVFGLLTGNVRFGATGTPSTMTMTSANTVTVVLGTYNATIVFDPARSTAAGTGAMTWTPVATPYDRAANPMTTTAATESGAADKEF